jgi:hypothetical protein
VTCVMTDPRLRLRYFESALLGFCGSTVSYIGLSLAFDLPEKLSARGQVALLVATQSVAILGAILLTKAKSRSDRFRFDLRASLKRSWSPGARLTPEHFLD